MARGGYRGGHRPSNFQNSPTRVVRVPEILAEEILAIAHKLDEGKPLVEIVQKQIDLSNIKIYKLHKQDVVRIDDLLRCGYKLN